MGDTVSNRLAVLQHVSNSKGVMGCSIYGEHSGITCQQWQSRLLGIIVSNMFAVI